MSVWQEAKHPRDRQGEFASKGGGGAAGAAVHGWITSGTAGHDPAVRKANVDRAKTGVLKRGQRQSMSIGMGLGVAGGSSDIERPIADALTQSVRSGKDRYVIPTAFGMSASDRPVTTGSGYIKVTPQGEVSDWRRASSAEQPRQRAVMSDHTVRAILDAHLSKTQTYVKPTPKAKKDPDVQPRSVVARLVKDIQGTPALNSQKYWERAIEVADKSGHPDLIPQEWRRAVAKRSRGHEVFALRTRLLCERAGIDL